MQRTQPFKEAINDFIQTIMDLINKVAPIKERQVKEGYKQQFHGEIVNEIKIVINYLKSMKNQNYKLSKTFTLRQAVKSRK